MSVTTSYRGEHAGVVGGETDRLELLLDFALDAMTVQSIARACRDHLPSAPQRLLVGGGGVRNPVLMASLERALPDCRVEPFDALGVPADAAEAMAFSLLGRNRLLGIPNHLPKTTGASHPRILGTITPATQRGRS